MKGSHFTNFNSTEFGKIRTSIWRSFVNVIIDMDLSWTILSWAFSQISVLTTTTGDDHMQVEHCWKIKWGDCTENWDHHKFPKLVLNMYEWNSKNTSLSLQGIFVHGTFMFITRHICIHPTEKNWTKWTPFGLTTFSFILKQMHSHSLSSYHCSIDYPQPKNQWIRIKPRSCKKNQLITWKY